MRQRDAIAHYFRCLRKAGPLAQEFHLAFYTGISLSSEHGTYKTVKARFWPRLSETLNLFGVQSGPRTHRRNQDNQEAQPWQGAQEVGGGGC